MHQMHAQVSIVSSKAELANLSCLFYFIWKYLKYFSYMLKDMILYKFREATDSWTHSKTEVLAVILHNHTKDQSRPAAL